MYYLIAIPQILSKEEKEFYLKGGLSRGIRRNAESNGEQRIIGH